MEEQRETPPCSCLQSSGTLEVNRLGQSKTAHTHRRMTESKRRDTGVTTAHANTEKTQKTCLYVC